MKKAATTTTFATTIISAAALLGLLFVSPVTMGASTAAYAAPPSSGFATGVAPYLTGVDAANDSVKAIITDGDLVGNEGYRFARIPDGVGAFVKGEGNNDDNDDRGEGRKLNVFVSHELNNGTNHGSFAKVSKLILNRNAEVLKASYVVDGSEMYERFCSSSLVEGSGFAHPVYFANEEVDDGIVVGIDAKTGKKTEMPWLGRMSHENTILVSHFYESAGKTVVITTEDGEATESEVYMYVADSVRDLMEGKGQLYVFAADAPYSSWDDIYFSTGAVSGRFVPLSWDYRTQDEADLHTEAIAKGAFQFIRPEDAAVDKRQGKGNVMYMADTGNDKDENGVPIPAGSNGQSWERGRMYKFAFTDPQDPTKASLQVIMDGNDPAAPGYSAQLKMAMSNPDNIDTSENSLMIQEDRIGATRSNPTGDMTNNAKIIRVPLASIDAGFATMETVAYNNQNIAPAAKHGDWESSGILDVSGFFGQGSWLVTVQAHSQQEGGQLLLLKVDGS